MIFLFTRTSFGRQVRALASDRETAQLHGVPVARMSMLSFGLSAALAGIAGVLTAPLNGFETTLGFGLMLGGFAAAILGGFGRLGGVVVGGFLIGFVENFVGYYWFRDYKSLYPLRADAGRDRAAAAGPLHARGSSTAHTRRVGLGRKLVQHAANL